MTESMRRLQQLAVARSGYFNAAEARACGVTRTTIARALADGRIIRLLDRVYRFAMMPPQMHERIVVAWLYTSGGYAVVSHQSALELAGIEPVGEVVHLTVPRRERGCRLAAGVRRHTRALELPETALMQWNGVPATRVTWTLLDVANGLTYPEFLDCVRRALRLGWIFLPRLRTAAERRGGRARIFVRRFLGERYRDYIREAREGARLYHERLARAEVLPEMSPCIASSSSLPQSSH